ncbi:MAG: phage terminase large subunit family protein [Oscillospiraceae bacterium]|nr:phage terminase large subunit family protein [Oscillospiraceae bacterium]
MDGRTNGQAAARLNRCIAPVLSGMKPPDCLTVTDWAEKYRRLSSESSAEPGLWRTSRTPYLREVMNAFTDVKVRSIVMVAASQVGKALAADTPIATPDGWAAMAELQPGDQVYDDAGNVCSVLAATEIMTGRPCYRVRFSDGAEITADASHKWYVETGGKQTGTVKTTEEIAADCSGADADGRRRNKYAVPVAAPICGAERELPFPPYTLGVWLGDGNSYAAQVTCHMDDAEIAGYMRSEGVRVVIQRAKDNDRVLNLLLDPVDKNFCCRGHDLRAVGKNAYGECRECHRQWAMHSRYGKPMDERKESRCAYHRLNAMGLLRNKHIPAEYLRASYAQRLALLQGIMDTDGSISQKGRCELTLKSEYLIDGVAELLSSLGIKYTKKEKSAVCTNAVKPYRTTVFRLSFLVYADTPVFRLKRKLARLIARDDGRRRCSETLRRRIVSVEETESVPVKCIAVDSPSRLYLAGRQMIPTHNSEAINNCIGYIIDEDPGSILFIHPTTVDAKEYSKLRIAPLLRDSPTLRKKVSAPKSRDSANTILQKSYPGGILTMCGSTEAHALASKPIRYVFGDERDRWALSAGREGDPWQLAMARQTTFYNAKSVEVSTPTIRNASVIADSYAKGTQERWRSQCPHCGGWHEIRWQDIRFEYDTATVNRHETYAVTRIWYVCPECACVSTEAEMKRAPARWEADNPAAKGTRSFWLNAFVSQWASWESIILKFLSARGNSREMQVVYNTCFGELWEDRGDIESEDGLMARREKYDAELPDGVLVLTAGIDTQDDRMEYEIVGYGHFSESWGIEKGVVMGRPDSDAVWEKLDELVFDRTLRFGWGGALPVSLSFVDEGGHFTQSVRQRCRDRIGKRVFCIKGVAGGDRPYTEPPKQMKIVINERTVGFCWQYQIGVDAGKQIIMDNLHKQEPGPNFCHFPLRDDYGERYFAGLLSERLVYNEKKAKPWEWVKIPGHERNEALDCRNYANAAFTALPKDLDAIDRSLAALRRGETPKRAAAKPPPRPAARTAPRTGADSAPEREPYAGEPAGLGRYYDDW